MYLVIVSREAKVKLRISMRRMQISMQLRNRSAAIACMFDELPTAAGEDARRTAAGDGGATHNA
jgi:hypothetical protein